MAEITTYNSTDLTGGVARSLNSISEAVLIDGDRCHVAYNGDFYVYEYDATATDAQNSPSIIRPLDYASAGVWKNQTVLGSVQSVVGVDVDNTDPLNPIVRGFVPVEILAVGGHGVGSYNLPGSDEWVDYSHVEIITTFVSNSAFTNSLAKLTSEAITENPTNWEVRNSVAAVTVDTIATSATTFDITGVGANMAVKQITGFKKL